MHSAYAIRKLSNVMSSMRSNGISYNDNINDNSDLAIFEREGSFEYIENDNDNVVISREINGEDIINYDTLLLIEESVEFEELLISNQAETREILESNLDDDESNVVQESNQQSLDDEFFRMLEEAEEWIDNKRYKI